MSEVLEYLFFTRAIADQFAAALDEQGLPYQVLQMAVHSPMEWFVGTLALCQADKSKP